ncbi:NAD-dependent epimerase/dehydratase family protein [Roseibium sp. RKSG952]|uniref:NAD-dependent epimerase/dehydratase family protein n=1 Tax=Roseibium sp. RKSG952 TaxID=2529384 RepID=UPI0012BC6FF7|nr:NAD-dependent epimerase/dehydratase family protein [Roseibium sp. RKSG952]MTI01802.1 NAD-dependent epimerase/dehydratase family protein [Roseibium sp. RKSG952]
MNIFVLGATGLIGSQVTAQLLARGHSVTGLCRSSASCAKLQQVGAQVCRGDLRQPEGWADRAIASDVVLQIAATFDEEMAQVDFLAMEALRRAAKRRGQATRCIYTGGVWLYGDTGGDVVDETSAFSPIPEFSWMLETANVLAADDWMDLAVLHPGLVYDSNARGMFHRFDAQIQHRQPVEIWGSAETLWPLVHVEDLAMAYVLLCENRDLSGHFNAVTEVGVAVKDIVLALSTRREVPYRTHVVPRSEALAKYGSSEGPMLSQRVSGRRLKDLGWTPRYDDFRKALAPIIGA